MKKSGIIISFIVTLFATCLLSACGKGGTTPVDEYVAILDAATEKAEKISSKEDLLNVKDIISPEAAMKIMRDNADYELTGSDKEKLKKSYDKLLRVAYEKTAEYGGLPDAIKEQTKDQIQLFIDAANEGIDRAHTMGELVGVR